jgi:hypothetical protein
MLADRGKAFGDAGAAFLVAAFGQRMHHGALVGKILVERADRDARALGKLAHAQGVAARLRDHVRRIGKNGVHPLAAAFLGGGAAHLWFGHRVFRAAATWFRLPLTNTSNPHILQI